MVSIRGRPAATSEPKARTRIARVTGQEMNSDRSMALRLAALKSDHMPDAPVRWTEMPPRPASVRRPLSESAALTIPFESRAAPAWTTAVWPSREIETPGRGGTTALTAELELRIRSVAATRDRNARSLTVVVGECTMTMSP